MDQTDAVEVAGEAPASSTRCDRTELLADLLVRIFGAMQIKDLRSPCLVYSAADRDDGTATLHHLSTDKLQHITLPDPAFRSRYVMGSSHGWLITADERSTLILVNPVTGAQIIMPPPETMPNVELRYGEEEEDGKPADGYNLLYVDTVPHNLDHEPKPYRLSLEQGRFPFYMRVALSCDPSSGGNCIVVRLHMPHHLLSYARVGDTKWTWVDTHEECKRYVDVCYDSGDGLFYALRGCGDVHTIDLHGPSPVVNVVYKYEGDYTTDSKYIVQSPWGDFFQIWRWDRYLEDDEDTEEEEEEEEEDDDNHVDETVDVEVMEDEDETESEVDEHEEVEVENKDCDDETETEEEEVDNVDVSEEEEEEEQERVTANFHVYKIDFAEQKLAKVNNLQDHTLFTGFNTSFLLPAKDFLTLIPNNIYHADDLNLNTFSKRFSDRRDLTDQGLRQVIIFNMEDSSFTDILPPTSSRLNWPPPVWIQPYLFGQHKSIGTSVILLLLHAHVQCLRSAWGQTMSDKLNISIFM